MPGTDHDVADLVGDGGEDFRFHAVGGGLIDGEGMVGDRRYIQRIEKGTANPGIDVLCRLKAVLQVDWEELLEGRQS